MAGNNIQNTVVINRKYSLTGPSAADVFARMIADRVLSNGNSNINSTENDNKQEPCQCENVSENADIS